jgi:diamine N-acetyltransferase
MAATVEHPAAPWVPQAAHSPRCRVAALQSPRVDVELREITKETVRAICALEVGDEQREFVAPNALSIAEAHFVPTHWMRAIYADEEPAGFVLTHEDPAEGTYYLWRFMVAERYQRRGVGRRAMELLLERWRALRATAATLSVVPANPGAITFYESLGFRLTGEEHGGELAMRAELEPHG